MARNDDERRILEMFSYMRPAGSKTEQDFVDEFLTPLGFRRDKFHNLVLTVGDSPTILWSSHMDTVHRVPGRQTLYYDGHILALSKHAKRTSSTCLGADDTAGIWLMTEMVKAGVPGLYIIHHAEEEGCIGSRALSRDHGGLLDGIQAAIAFDRRGYNSVVTHQTGGKTASNAFAESLCGVLGGLYEADDTGVYTDTNEYAGIIPECTNISVGYFAQHSTRETQDVVFLIDLRNALITSDFTSLVIERTPGDDGWNEMGRSWSSYYGGSLFEPEPRSRYDGLEGYVRAYPEIAAQLLEAMGIGEQDFRSTLTDLYGDVEDEDEAYEDDNHSGGGRSYAPFQSWRRHAA